MKLKGINMNKMATFLFLFTFFFFASAQRDNSINFKDNGGLTLVQPLDEFDTIAMITLSEIDINIYPGYIGDTVVVPVHAELNELSLHSSEMHFTGFQSVLGFEGIVTEGTSMGDSDWSVIIHEQEDTLIIGHYGSDAIYQDGILFYLKFSVSDILPESVVPIELTHVELNEKEGVIETIDGSVSIGHLFHIGITETVGIPGDTVSISVHANLWQNHSFEITLSGLEGGNISAVAVDTAGTILDSDWMWSYTITDSGNVIVMAESGVTTSSDNGVLFNVHFAIDIESMEGFNPLFITSAAFSGEDNQFETDHGGVVVSALGDVSMDGRVGAYDAGLILLHLVGLESFNNDQIAIGNVTYDNSLSALDAVIILDYVVGLVEELPFDGSSMSADGSFVISGGSINPGEIFQMPIMLTDGSDIRSFELEFGYDPESLNYQSVVWNTDVMPDLQILDNQDEGIVRVSAAGMGYLSPGELTLGWIEFQVDDFFNDYQTSVIISRSRANERIEEVDGSIAVYTNSMLAGSNDEDGSIPSEFALSQNYPNPFNPLTTISYQLTEDLNVTIEIYDITGAKIRTLIASEMHQAGYCKVIWNATNDVGQPVSAGMYIYTIQAGEFRSTKKMLLLK